MNYKDIQSALSALSQASYQLEAEFVENGGEVTEATELMSEQVETIKELLTTEGIDSLGRWLKLKEDEVKALKAEKDYVSRKIDAATNTIEFIKEQINIVMSATGEDRIKGSLGYSFARTTSVKTQVEKEVLKEMFLSKVEEKLRKGKNPVIPEDVTITLGASVKALPEGAELPAYYSRIETPSCRFTKPRTKES